MRATMRGQRGQGLRVHTARQAASGQLRMHPVDDQPSAWVVRWAPLVERGPVLDVASGAGRHCKVFLQQKLPVVAVDHNLFQFRFCRVCAREAMPPW